MGLGQLGAGWVREAISAPGASCPSSGSQDSVGSGRECIPPLRRRIRFVKMSLKPFVLNMNRRDDLHFSYNVLSAFEIKALQPHRMSWEVAPFQFSGRVYAELVLFFLQWGPSVLLGKGLQALDKQSFLLLLSDLEEKSSSFLDFSLAL